MSIREVTQNNYPELIEVWESSVRASHDFLPEENIAELKPLILNHYFDAVELRCYMDNKCRIVGFIGVQDSNIEMLFVKPDCFGQNIGRKLTEYAIKKLKAATVDVNEQNPKAIGFYERLGFAQTDRSEFDGQGKAFPLIHMRLNN
jgi:putative acetyltransferase